MTRGRLLFVLWCSSTLAAVRSFTVSGHLCVSDFFTGITCVMNISGGPVVRSNNLSLKFRDESKNNNSDVSCPVVATDQGFLCHCEVSNITFMETNFFMIELCHESTCQVVQPKFFPFFNIKLTPPPELELGRSTGYVNITCKSERYKRHLYFPDFLNYELLIQESTGSWNRTFYLSSSRCVEPIDTSQLKPNTEYCVKAKFKTYLKNTWDSIWSEWSDVKCWTTEQKEVEEEEKEDIALLLLKSLGPVCVTAGVLLFVFYNPATRMKIKTLAHTPTPAPFFKPLFQQHDGNLQEWLSPRGKCILTYKTEENLIADAVTVVPKSIPKDLEETHVFFSPPATQLAFSLSHTSYVGLPGMDKAPSPVPGLCPGDTPYTQLPCSIWGFSVQEIEVVPSDPKEFLEISHSDSGCEDLTQSPECSLPCSPVDEIPTPIHCTDYCILNKTAEGVVPVLLSKERAGDAASGSLKSEG